MITKWKRLSSKIAFKDKWITLRSDSYETKAGKILEPYYISEYPTWVNILPITSDLKVIVLKHFRPGADEILFEIPGGLVDSSDTSSESAAKRELQEETGFGNGNLYQVGSYYANPANQNNLTQSFLAINLELVDTSHPETGEDFELQELPLKDFMEFLHTNRNNNSVQALHMTNLFFSLSFILKSNDENLQSLREIVKNYYFAS